MLNIARLFSGLKKRSIIFLCLIFICNIVFSQEPRFGLATDLSMLRSFKKEQRFWAIGQTINFNFHFTSRDGAYAWLSYYTKGEFSNDLAATAKSGTTVPQQIHYQNSSEMRLKHISLGWKRYLKGASDIETKWSLYGYSGFGLMFGRILNTHSVPIDTSDYIVPVQSGKAKFKRLTFDLGAGFEKPIGGDIYFYLEARVLIPTTDYPSEYLLVNDNAPLTAAANFGFRILF